jgi:hypothetical protein
VTESLVLALGEPAVSQLRSSNFGITQQWLEDNVDAAARKNHR